MDSMRFSNIAVIITKQVSHKKSTQSTQHGHPPLSLASLSNPTPEYRWDQLLFRRQLCKSITSSSHLTLQTLIQDEIWKDIIYFCESNKQQIIQLHM